MFTKRYPQIRIVLLMLLLLLSSGCSMIRVGYGHFDSVAAWMVHEPVGVRSDPCESHPAGGHVDEEQQAEVPATGPASASDGLGLTSIPLS